MENSSKARKITPNYVDNYVDGVDRTVYMHQSGENIYTTARMLFPDHTAWRNRVRCKTVRHDSYRIRTVETAIVTRFTHPPRNKLIRAAAVREKHVIKKERLTVWRSLDQVLLILLRLSIFPEWRVLRSYPVAEPHLPAGVAAPAHPPLPEARVSSARVGRADSLCRRSTRLPQRR